MDILTLKSNVRVKYIWLVTQTHVRFLIKVSIVGILIDCGV